MWISLVGNSQLSAFSGFSIQCTLFWPFCRFYDTEQTIQFTQRHSSAVAFIRRFNSFETFFLGSKSLFNHKNQSIRKHHKCAQHNVMQTLLILSLVFHHHRRLPNSAVGLFSVYLCVVHRALVAQNILVRLTECCVCVCVFFPPRSFVLN